MANQTDLSAADAPLDQAPGELLAQLDSDLLQQDDLVAHDLVLFSDVQAASDLVGADANLTGCQGGNVAQTYTDPTMVVCEAAPGVNQCGASNYCAAGWHLCSASEYLARGGQNTAGPTLGSWLAGCIRNGNVVQAPKDGICGSCVGTLDALEPVNWACTSGDPKVWQTYIEIGLRAHWICYRAGTNTAQTEAFWAGTGTAVILNLVTCCQ